MRTRRRWPWVLVIIAVAFTLAGMVGLRWLNRWVHGRVEAELSRALGRPVRAGDVSIGPRGIALDDVRMPRRAAESADPLVARRAWLSTDWLRFLRTRQIRVTSVAAEDVRIDVAAPRQAPGGPRWNDQVLAFTHDGLRHFELHRAAIVVRDSSGRASVQLDGVDGSAELQPSRFSYRVAADRVVGGVATFDAVAMEGGGTHEGADVTAAHARFAGSTLSGRAHYQSASDAIDVHLAAQGVPLAVIAPLVPADLHVGATSGSVSFDAGARIAAGRISTFDVTLHGRDGTVSVGPGTYRFTQVDGSVGMDVRGQIHTTGTVRLDRVATEVLVHSSPIAPAIAQARLHAAELSASFDVSFPRAAPSALQAHGHVHFDDTQLRLARTLPPMEFRVLDADLRRDGDSLQIDHVAVHDGAVSFGGAARIDFAPGARPRLDLQVLVRVTDLRALRRFVPREGSWPSVVARLPTGRARVEVHASARIGDPDSVRVNGTAYADGFRDRVRFPLPGHTNLDVPIETLRAQFAFEAGRGAAPDRFTVRNVVIDGPVGRVMGEADLVGERYHIAANIENGDHKVIDWLVPGTIGGGTLSGTLDLRGSGSRGVDVVSGHFVGRNTAYVPPGTMHLVGQPIAVAEFSGDYHWHASTAVIDHVVLRGTAVQGTGRFDIAHGTVRVRAALSTHEAGRVTDYWPALHGLIRGGQGNASLDITVHNDEARGSLEFVSRGGTVVIPHASSEAAVQPMESGAGRIEFGPDRVLIRGLSLRGPNVNADISGAWPDGKTVHLAGRIWLTPRYVSQLLGGWRFLARVAGLRSIDTQFRLFGTLDRVMLSTDFTRSMFWRLGHGRIPRDVQDVLTTRRPVTSLAPTGGGP